MPFAVGVPNSDGSVRVRDGDVRGVNEAREQLWGRVWNLDEAVSLGPHVPQFNHPPWVMATYVLHTQKAMFGDGHQVADGQGLRLADPNTLVSVCVPSPQVIGAFAIQHRIGAQSHERAEQISFCHGTQSRELSSFEARNVRINQPTKRGHR